jgi:hypothetical protein
MRCCTLSVTLILIVVIIMLLLAYKSIVQAEPLLSPLPTPSPLPTTLVPWRPTPPPCPDGNQFCPPATDVPGALSVHYIFLPLVVK